MGPEAGQRQARGRPLNYGQIWNNGMMKYTPLFSKEGRGRL